MSAGDSIEQLCGCQDCKVTSRSVEIQGVPSGGFSILQEMSPALVSGLWMENGSYPLR